jgi:hypothetical protein
VTTKAQRKMRRVAETHGKQYALERAVLNAARALRGAIQLRGITGVTFTTWARFLKAEDALNDFHAERQRSTTTRRAKDSQ